MRLTRALLGVCCWLVVGCRDSNSASDGDREESLLQEQGWAAWPMPNAGAGLPNPQSFEVRAGGIVHDRVTDLMWQQMVGSEQLTFADANQHCEQLSLGKYDDWRLPSRVELISILDTTRTEPAINLTAFPDTPDDWFWTATSAGTDGQSAWYVYFYFGYPDIDLISNQFSVRCVRSDEAIRTVPATHYDPQTDTVRDQGTGLTWQRGMVEKRLSFEAAQVYCAGLDLGGKSEWRVPSLSELLSLIDERATDAPMIDRKAFPDTPAEAFWTSSLFGGVPGQSWQVHFDRGNGLYGLPSAAYWVRCVTASP